MSLLMEALKRAEQAKSRGNNPVSLPVESEVLTLSENTEHQGQIKEILVLEPVITAGPVSEPIAAVELNFAIDNVEPVIDREDTSKLSLARDASELAVTPEPKVSVVEVPPITEKFAVEVADLNGGNKDVTSAPSAKPVMADQMAATPLKTHTDRGVAGINASPARPQVPVMIGKPRFNRSYLWAGLLLLCFVAGLSYYFQALNSFGSINTAVLPVVNDDNVHIDDENTETVADLTGGAASTSVAEIAVISNIPSSVVKKLEPAVAGIFTEKAVASDSERVRQRDQSPMTIGYKKQNAILKTEVDVETVAQPSLLQIDKVVVADPLQALLQSAYNAYGAGDLAAASDFYRQVQSREADNRDALLGLAVIAQHQGKSDSAGSFYARLLVLNPKDSVAAAGMVSLNNGSVTTQGISRLKLLLQEEPAAAHLHFFLANEYAAQSRWPEAQQSYFQAYHYAPAQADYAFNLAVSLEKLGQSQVALEYYRRALIAADKSTPSFDTQRLIQRIDTLTARQ